MFSIFEELWKYTIQFAYKSPNVINGFTAFFVLFCTLLLFTVWINRTAPEEWAKYFTISYCILSGMFLLMFVFGIAEKGKWLNEDSLWKGLSTVFISVGSGLNNLYIYAAAKELSGKRFLFPKLLLLITILTILASIQTLSTVNFFLFSLPDALFSIFCLGYFGYVMGQQITPGRICIKTIILATTAFYCLAQIIYASTPCFVENDTFTFLIHYVQKFSPDTLAEKKQFLESLWKILTLPFKALFIYFANYILIRQVVKTPLSDMQGMVEVTHGPEFAFFSKEGVLKKIGETLNADRVIVAMILPKETIVTFNWCKAIELKKKERSIFKLQDDLTKTEDVSFIPVQNTIRGCKSTENSIPEGYYSIIKEITFLGCTIGALEIRWNNNPPISSFDKRVEGWAALLAPSVQFQRELASLNDIGNETTKWVLEETDLKDFDTSVQKIADIVQDNLAPKGTTIEIDFGFKRISVNSSLKLSKDKSDSKLSEEIKLKVEVKEVGIGSNEIQSKYLQTFHVGTLTLVVPSNGNKFRPWLGRDNFYRSIVTVLVMESFFDIVRLYFTQTIRTFYDDLTQDRHRYANTHEEESKFWFKTVQDFANRIGFTWVIAEERYEDKEFFHGEDRWRKVIHVIHEFTPTLNVLIKSKATLSSAPLNPAIEETCVVIRMELEGSQTILYLGVSRAGFGDELLFPSPWRTMLERVGHILDAAIIQWRVAVERREAITKAAKVHALATTASIYGTLAHQIVNLARDAAGPIKNFHEAILLNEVKIEDDFLRNSMSSALKSLNHLTQVISSLANFRMIESERPCCLFKILEESLRIFSPTLTSRNIQVDIEMSQTVMVDVPKFAVSMALTNLIDNAKDALTKTDRPNRRITIEAIDFREAVVCKVTDNGEGIPLDQQERIFDFGSTSKKGGGGLGLYLTRLTLSENRSLLTLDSTGPEETTFSIRFPKVITTSIAEPDSASNTISTHIEE